MDERQILIQAAGGSMNEQATIVDQVGKSGIAFARH